MPSFAYQVRDASGRMERGAIAAASLAEASQAVRKGGKSIVSLDPDSASDAPAGPRARKKVKRDDVIYMATQLAVMVDTGVPLPEALGAVADQTEHPGMKAMVQDISEAVQGGVEFSAALERHPQCFSKMFVAMMKASEASGTMGQMLQRVSEYLQREQETRRRVKGAMVYPASMMTFCVLVLIGLLVFILPRFEKIYAGKGAVLPLPTRILMGLSNTLIHYWAALLAGLIGGGVGLWYYLRTPGGRVFMDRVRISLPILGPMYRKACLSRSLRTMSTMVSSGVNVLDGLSITSQVAGSQPYEQVWLQVAEKVKEGSTISAPLRACPLVPRTICQMIHAGERTGKLGAVLDRVAGFCEDDLNVAIKTATSMIEPVMIIVMGLIVGGIAISLLLPVFSLSKVMAH